MITPIPSLSRTSPTFKAEVNTLYGTTLPNFSNELNAEFARISTLEFGAYTATSTTSLSVTVGSKALTIETGKGFVAGQPVQIARTSDPSATYMIGIVDSYNSGTGALVVDVSEVAGTGTFTDWTISVTSVKTVSVPYVNEYRTRLFATTTQSFVVPAGVTSLRAYAGGAGGNGATSTASGNSGGGGGGGFAYGDFAVTPGATVSITIATGDATVVYNSITMLSALNGANASAGTGGAGGASSKDVLVTNGGAFTGGAGGGSGSGSGGGSCGSPLGNGFTGGSGGSPSAGGGIGANGSIGNTYGGGGGGAGAAGFEDTTHATSYGGGSSSTAASIGLSGGSRGFDQRFTDPLLAHAAGTGGVKILFGSVRSPSASSPGPGGGGAGGSTATSGQNAFGQNGGDFGGGGGATTGGQNASATGGNGGFMGGGGGAFASAATFSATGGNGGYGGGGGGATTNGGSATAGTGGAAFVVIYY